SSFSIKGQLVYHYCIVPSFSEYPIVHSGCVVRVRPNAPMDKLCLFNCGVATGLSAAIKCSAKGHAAVLR
ncbi:Alcohol dehydrogenase-like 6, partial [Bienertia sinuspersici]